MSLFFDVITIFHARTLSADKHCSTANAAANRTQKRELIGLLYSFFLSLNFGKQSFYQLDLNYTLILLGSPPPGTHIVGAL